MNKPDKCNFGLLERKLGDAVESDWGNLLWHHQERFVGGAETCSEMERIRRSQQREQAVHLPGEGRRVVT